MIIDDMDLSTLRELYDEDMIRSIDPDNVSKIYNYLSNNNVYFAKDIFISDLELYLLDYDEFVKRFERLKNTLGKDFISKLEDDFTLFDIMYEDI